MPCVFVTQDGDSVDRTAAVKVSLQFFRRGAVVHLRETGGGEGGMRVRTGGLRRRGGRRASRPVDAEGGRGRLERQF